MTPAAITPQRVNGYLQEPWQGLASFPRDGQIVEVRDRAGGVWLAKWNRGCICIDSEIAIEPTHWRPSTPMKHGRMQ